VPSLSAITTIFTIGHSTHEADAFLRLLRRARIEAVADVRRYPSSRRMPWFNRAELAASLESEGIAYEHYEALGGRRNPRRESPNRGWRVGQFQGYADHMDSEEFRAALDRLLALAAERRTAAMCAEAQWTRCHRRLLADALLARGVGVTHIGSRGALERHSLTEFALVDGGRLTYPPLQQRLEA
jgi:uncharacterized protein (DUF488 family)